MTERLAATEMMSQSLKHELDELDALGILFTAFVEPDGFASEIDLVTKCGSFRTRISLAGVDADDAAVFVKIGNFVRCVKEVCR